MTKNGSMLKACLLGLMLWFGRDGEYGDYGTDEYDDEAQEVADQL